MPAPTRNTQRFPQSWGYAVGLVLIITGVALGITIAVTGFKSLYDDVRALQRNAQNGEILASLERGDYVIYDEEEGFDIGPADIRVVRESDGQVIPTTSIEDGVDYDVDGRSGEAAVSVRLPTDDFYRIEVDTGVGEIAGFAFGQDLGQGPGGIIARSVLIGLLFAVPGLILLIYTGVQHARWAVRTRLADQLDVGRQAVQEAASGEGGSVDTARSAGRSRLDQLTSKAQQGIERARAEVQRRTPTTSEGEASRLQQEFAERASQALDRVETGLGSAADTTADQIDTADAGGLAGRVDSAMARVQDRLAAGDSLRDIARDERDVAVETARELKEQAAQTAASSRAEIEGQVAEVGTALSDAGEIARADAAGSFIDALESMEPVADVLRDDLVDVGTVAGAAATAAVVAGVDDAVGVELEDVVADWAPSPPDLPEPPPAEMLEELGLEALIDEPEPEAEPEPAPEPELEPEPEPEPERAPSVRASLAPPPPVAHGAPGIAPPPASSSILAPPPAAQLRALAAAPPTTSPPTVARAAVVDDTEATEEPEVDDVKPAEKPFSLAPPPDYSSVRGS